MGGHFSEFATLGTLIPQINWSKHSFGSVEDHTSTKMRMSGLEELTTNKGQYSNLLTRKK